MLLVMHESMTRDPKLLSFSFGQMMRCSFESLATQMSVFMDGHTVASVALYCMKFNDCHCVYNVYVIGNIKRAFICLAQ